MIIIVRHYRVTRCRFLPYILWYLWRMRKYYTIIRVDALLLNTLARLSRCAMNMPICLSTFRMYTTRIIKNHHFYLYTVKR